MVKHLILLVSLYQINIDGQTLDIVGKFISNYTDIITIDGQTLDIVVKFISNYTDIITIDVQTVYIVGKILLKL